jgi:hypothetical protein
VVDDCVSAVLVGSAGLRTLHFELLGQFKVFGGSAHKVDNVTAEDHLLFRETIAEKLVQSD